MDSHHASASPTWAPPRPLAPPTAPGTRVQPQTPPDRSDRPHPLRDALRRGLSSLSPVGWLAATGVGLLLVASIVVVASNWESIDASIRFAGLVAALAAVYFSAEAGRRW